MKATGQGGREYNDAELRAYNITEGCIGQYAVIQRGYACLGIGPTESEALADASACMGEPVEEDDPCENDGDTEVVEIEA
jgi:hypothetical protein